MEETEDKSKPMFTWNTAVKTGGDKYSLQLSMLQKRMGYIQKMLHSICSKQLCHFTQHSTVHSGYNAIS